LSLSSLCHCGTIAPGVGAPRVRVMHFREAKRKADNPFKREAKVIGGLILLLGIIALVAIFFGPHVN
jgi:hypothetical protein